MLEYETLLILKTLLEILLIIITIIIAIYNFIISGNKDEENK